MGVTRHYSREKEEIDDEKFKIYEYRICLVH